VGEEIKESTTKVEQKEEEKGAPEEKKAEEIEIESNWEEKVDTFDQLNLKEDLLRGIYGYGFTKPSPIQQKGILPLLKKKDTIAQVNSQHYF
jgi:translation initiation factor 4A